MTGYRSKVVTIAALSGLSALLVIGCRVESKKSDSGNGDNVKIATPFGGMSVKTDNSAIAQSTGLPTYPGAVPTKKKNKEDHNDGAADINMSFGSFQLRVKAVSFTTPDSPEEVLAFYKKSLGRFGTVIECRDHQAVGTPAKTVDGLTCSDDEKDNHVNVDEGVSRKTELKAGSKQHQHIVGIDPNPDGAGTKFALVVLDLPGHLNFGDNDSGKDKDENGDEGKQ
jgi:hypothetical protein